MKWHHPSLIVAFLSAILGIHIPGAFAGTVNVDFEQAAQTTASAKGALGTGSVWNGLESSTNNLNDDQGNPTQVDITITESDGAAGTLFPAGNDLQEEALTNSVPPADPRIVFSFTDLRGGEPYKIAVYAADGPLSPHTATATGDNIVTAPVPSLRNAPLPGVEGLDYIILDNVIADNLGNIEVVVDRDGSGGISWCCGVQIQGWFLGETSTEARQADLSVSRLRTRGFKGNNRYANRPRANQTVTQRGSRARFFFRLENDGSAFGDFTTRATRSGRDARRRYVALRPNRNITARISRGRYTIELEPAENQVIRAIIRASRTGRGRIDTDLLTRPAGLGGRDAARGRLRN